MYELMKAFGKVLAVVGAFLALIWKIAEIEELWWIIVGVAVLAGMLFWGADYVRHMQNRKNPVTAVSATVFSYRTETHGRYGQFKKYFLKFVTEQDKKRLEFEVPFADFENYQVGDKGILSYRTWEYISFQRTGQ